MTDDRGAAQPSAQEETGVPRARSRGPRRIKAESGARFWALVVDGVFLSVVVFIVMVVSLIASTPFWEVNGGDGTHTQASGLGNASLYALNDTVPEWVSWTIVALLGGITVLLSGALAKPGHRRSLGMGIAELRVVTWPVDLDRAFRDDLEDPGTVTPVRVPVAEIPAFDPARLEPGAARVAARWLVPYVVFVALVIPVGGLGAALLVLVGWLPALWGNRRSVYDLLAGVAVVDAVRLAGAAADARRG